MSASKSARGVTLRPADAGDVDRVFEWRNDPWIVSLGTTGATVDRAEHGSWFHRVLTDGGHLLFIIEIDAIAAGTVRFDRHADGRTMVTIYLLRPYTGKGYGVIALREGCERAFAAWPASVIHACVRQENAASLSAFVRAGFSKTGETACPPGHTTLALRRP